MKRLFISIIFSVISALFFINWGVDQLAEKSSNQKDSNEIIIYKHLLDGISQELSQVEINKLASHTQMVSERFHLELSIENAENMAFPEVLKQQLKREGGLLLGSNNKAYFIKEIPNYDNKLLRLQLPPQEDEDHINVILTSLLYLGVCFLIVLWLLPLTRSLYLLTNTAAKIGEGDLKARLPKNRFSYIQPLENSFNQMTAKLETLVADNKLLARSLSHDIRTPLACLRFGIEAALDTNDVDQKNQYIERMDTEITRMENMTAAFLEYAALERKSLRLNMKKTDISQLLSELISEIQPLADQKNIAIKTSLLTKAKEIIIDSHWYYLALQNIVSNALQYAKTTIFISIYIEKNQLVISIEDDGEGVLESDIDKIFFPFVRLNKENLRDNESFGLGLATTARVVEWHKGTIKAFNSKKHHGLCCQLIQPL